jgi:hypothetical protein
MKHEKCDMRGAGCAMRDFDLASGNWRTAAGRDSASVQAALSSNRGSSHRPGLWYVHALRVGTTRAPAGRCGCNLQMSRRASTVRSLFSSTQFDPVRPLFLTAKQAKCAKRSMNVRKTGRTGRSNRHQAVCVAGFTICGPCVRPSCRTGRLLVVCKALRAKVRQALSGFVRPKKFCACRNGQHGVWATELWTEFTEWTGLFPSRSKPSIPIVSHQFPAFLDFFILSQRCWRTAAGQEIPHAKDGTCDGQRTQRLTMEDQRYTNKNQSKKVTGDE